MANQDMKAKLVIDVEANGANDVEAIADGLEGLAQESGDAAPKLTELAQAIRAIGAGKKVLFLQFMKSKVYSEHTILPTLIV